ncbi:epoxide hydrolase [Saccharothrix sp. NPDC042600]|uniref:epoxide hydrolase family protein n=1 Tax=Saccharothrix TaxID=2071 RepID=UPI0033ED85D7|nr:epoxide hydrolase [Saccharothrix mutabilis subsp. capreolus]
MTEIREFRIAIPQADLDDLADRLDRTRWAAQLPGGRARGVEAAWLREWAAYWRDGFDWRAQEARLNALPQFMTEIDGLDVHFLHVRSQDPDATALLLVHGWPNSFVEFVAAVEHLRHFHLVIPSIPGFAFSEAPRERFTVADAGRMFATLMDRLGYARYGVQGGDLGAYIAPEVARAAPERVVGVYVNGGLGFPTADDDLTEDERQTLSWMAEWSSGSVDHHSLLRVAPQTFAHAWNDSPVGLLAWLLQKFREFAVTVELPEQAIDRDLLLVNAALYWFTGTSGSSSWFMYDNERFAWPIGQDLVPTGVYSGPPGIRRLAERHNRVVHWPEDNPGGHFVAMEEPVVFAKDLSTFLGGLR